MAPRRSNRSNKRHAAVPLEEVNEDDELADQDFLYNTRPVVFADGPTLKGSVEEQPSLATTLSDRVRVAAEELPRSVREQLTSDTMRLVLAMNVRREKCTTKKIQEMVLKDHAKKVKGLIHYVMAKVQKRFRSLFGYDLVLGSPVAPASAAAADKPSTQRIVATDTWFLLNRLQSDKLNRDVHDNADRFKRGLLMAILGIVMGEGGAIREEELWKQLERLGARRKVRGAAAAQRNNERIFSTQSAEDVVKELIKEMYLQRKRVGGDETNEDGSLAYNIVYGQRTLLEIGERNIFRFLAQTTKVKLDTREAKEFLGALVPSEVEAIDDEGDPDL